MNDNNLDQNNNKYVASPNLNTAIENPQINVSSATDVNVQDLGYNNQAVQTDNSVNSTFLNNSYEVNNQADGNANNYSPSINSSNNVNNYSPNINPSNNVNSNQSSNIVNNADVSAVNYSVSNNNSTYQPTLGGVNEKKESNISSLLRSGEFKVMILILFILCLFLLVMPYVYDYIKENLVR